MLFPTSLLFKLLASTEVSLYHHKNHSNCYNVAAHSTPPPPPTPRTLGTAKDVSGTPPWEPISLHHTQYWHNQIICMQIRQGQCWVSYSLGSILHRRPRECYRCWCNSTYHYSYCCWNQYRNARTWHKCLTSPHAPDTVVCTALQYMHRQHTGNKKKKKMNEKYSSSSQTAKRKHPH